ncbi:SDR family NAD(P)-dependent oxidoreductase [Flagellimonas sp. DF-77]|uniref:SDR family oxidoreductase n=1 Tax=Flagellimonas algarum TaxID=3230298 RepID=UPI0033980A45
MNVKGNTIVITGATRGIGLSLLERFHQLDNKIIAVARNRSALDTLAAKYEGIATIACDLSDPGSVDALVNTITEQHAETNILINNAGIQVNFYGSKFGEKPEVITGIKNEIQVNFTAPIELVFKLIPLLLQHKNPAVVNVSSGLAFSPKKSAPVYCGTKAGIHIFSKSLRYQFEDTDLKVFEIIPPLVDTDMTKGRGKGKLTPAQLVEEFIRAFRKDHYEINIGKTKLLRLIGRISPRLADSILKNN